MVCPIASLCIADLIPQGSACATEPPLSLPPACTRQTEKAVQRAAADFERSIEQGYALDNKQTFAEYAEYVLELKE